MSDYDLPADHRVALRRAKKTTTTGTLIILLAIFVPLGIEIGFLKRHHRELESGSALSEEGPTPMVLIGAGVVVGLAGAVVLAKGFKEESRAQKRAEDWRSSNAR